MKAFNPLTLVVLVALAVLQGCVTDASGDCPRDGSNSSDCQKAKSVEASGAAAPVAPR